VARKPAASGYFDGCLDVRDIPGTAAGTKRLGAFHSTSRRHFLNPNDTQDIEGAQVNTLKHGLQSKRVTDPLNPKYQVLGATELAGIDYNPYGDGSSLDPRFVANRKAMEARDQAMKPKALKEAIIGVHDE